MTRALAVIAVIAAWLTTMPASAGETLPPSAFFGRFIGESISSAEDGLTPRDLGVTIKPLADGFNVTWETVTHTEGKAAKRKQYSIDFQRTNRANIFRSGMRTDMFGQRVPLDPLSGDPFVWAHIAGATLTVHALLIGEDGAFEMQTYARTRTLDGLDLVFTRMREREVVRVIKGRLTRVD
ncbi:MAG: hypothetical protein MUE49_11600 [Rhodospirillales bacterium]|nr:hypothetical protein [Rhodospirillales bacterium]